MAVSRHASRARGELIISLFVAGYDLIELFCSSRSSHEIGRGYPPRNLYLELERERERSCIEGSPPSDNVMFDNQCYATTPSSSNGNSDQDQSYGQQQQQQPSQQQQQQSHSSHQPHPPPRGSRHQHHQHQQAPNVTPTPGSPTSRLLMEYEMHLRNTLAKGMDAESYSLHTFEALLSQSMENLGEFNASLLASSLVLVLVWVSAFSSSIRFAVFVEI